MNSQAMICHVNRQVISGDADSYLFESWYGEGEGVGGTIGDKFLHGNTSIREFFLYFSRKAWS